MKDFEDEGVTAWVTKRALSWGIYIVKDAWTYKESPTELFYKSREGVMVAYGDDWHLTPESALARAEEMRSNRIKDLKDAIIKLEEFKFRLPTKDKNEQK